MAKTKSDLPVGYSIGSHSIYKMKGCSHLVVRAKGGPSKKMLKKSPVFEGVRKHNKEFGASSLASGYIQRAIYAVKHLADHNISGQLMGMAKIIQNMDINNEHGKRSILFSAHPHILDGFGFNNDHPFDSVIKSPPAYTISRDNLMAKIVLPDLIPGVNFTPIPKAALYRIILCFGVIPDVVRGQYQYEPASSAMGFFPNQVQTGWASTAIMRKREELIIQLSELSNFDDTGSLILSIGIEFATRMTAEIIKPMKNMGCGKILAHV